MSLAILGFQRTVTWLSRTAKASGLPGGREHVEHSIAAMRRVKRYTPWTGRCLARSLSLWWVLRRRALDAQLHLGVKRDGGSLEAHAWVTHDGAVLADHESVWTEFPGTFQAGSDLAITRR